MSDAVAKKLLDEFMEIEEVYLKLRQSYLPKFRKALPENKVLRYSQIVYNYIARVEYGLAKRIPPVK